MNLGKWEGTEEAAIVDSTPGDPSIYTDVKKVLLNDRPLVNLWKERTFCFKKLSGCSQEMRLGIAKKYLAKWDLTSRIDEAYKGIEKEMVRMKQQRIKLKQPDFTKDFRNYIDCVKENLESLKQILKAEE